MSWQGLQIEKHCLAAIANILEAILNVTKTANSNMSFKIICTGHVN